MLLALHAICVNAITTYEGRVAQYLGDGILAYFSYPEAHEDDPRRAVLAGLEIVNGVVARGSGIPGRFGIDIQIRVGIDTGLVSSEPSARAAGPRATRSSATRPT